MLQKEREDLKDRESCFELFKKACVRTAEKRIVASHVKNSMVELKSVNEKGESLTADNERAVVLLQ